jgi:hypothetical protein
MRTVLPIALLLVFVLAFFSNVIFGDRVLLTTNPAHYEPWSHYAGDDEIGGRASRTDALFTYLPRQAELSRRIRAGDFPLWNPNVFCGAPFFADPQSRALYPFTLALVSVDPVRAFGYDVALHVFLAMLGMYLFLRLTGASVAGCLAGAISYGLSSFFASRMGHPTFVASAAWIPFLFFAYERARRGMRGGGGLLTVFLVLGYLAGFPQVFLFGVTSLVIYAFYMTAESALAGEANQVAGLLRSLAIPAGLSLLMVSVHLVPFKEFVDNSAGLGYDFETMKRMYMWNPVFLLRSLFPNLFGNPADGTSWIVFLKQDVHHQNTGFLVYCGAGSFLLVWGSLAYARVSRHIRAALLLLIVSVGIATSGALLKAAYAVMPFIGYSQIDRISVISCFSVSMLCGLTLSAVSSGKYPKPNRALVRIVAVVLAVIIIASIVFLALRGDVSHAFADRANRFQQRFLESTGHARLGEWLDGTGDAWFAFVSRQVALGLVFFVVAAGALFAAARARGGVREVAAIAFLVFLALDVSLAARVFYVTQSGGLFGETPGIEFLKKSLGKPGTWRIASSDRGDGALPSNTGQVFGIHSVPGRATAVPEAYADFVYRARTLSGGGVAPPAVKGALSAAVLGTACARFVVAGTGSPAAPAADYVRIYDGDMLIYENAAALEKGICVARSEVGEVDLRGEPALGIARALLDPSFVRAGAATVLSYEADRIEMDVVAEKQCYLIVQDLFYPGWQVTVDGVRGRIRRTDLGFRAVPLEGGRHRIVMEFRPKSFNIGLVLTSIGIGLSVLYAAKAKARVKS